MRIVLTGAATLAGAEVLQSLLQEPGVTSIQLLMPCDEAPRRDQLHRLESFAGAFPQAVSVVDADLTHPRFGFSLAAWERFAASFDAAIHCAQRDTLDQNLAEARNDNLLPVENWIALLEQHPSIRLHHLSTAFTAGTRRGLYTEFDLECGQDFHNAYERSKFEAEVRLRESRVSDRVTIYRPSHIVGHSATGAACQLTGGYPLLATLASASILPGDGRARIDFVPANYVGASMVRLALHGASGTFHLACGWHASPTVKEAAALAAKGLGRRGNAALLPRILAPALRIAGSSNPGELASRQQAFANARDLLNAGPVFDTYLADRELSALGIVRPSPGAFLENVVRVAAARSWMNPDAPRATASSATVATPRAVAIEVSAMNGRLYQKVGDINVAYHIAGEGEPVVFLHGFGGPYAWDAVVERIAVKRQAVVVETLGLSDTEGPESADYGPSAQAALLRGLLSRLDISSAHIVGNDIGGLIAQFFAVRWPHCVKSLVLSDCAAHAQWPPSHIETIARLATLPGGTPAWKLPIIAKAAFRDLVHDPKFLTTARLERYRETVAGSPEKRMRLRQFIRSLQKTDLATLNHMLAQLDVPTMIVWGADHASASWARTLYDAIPGARRLELIPFAGIACHEERPDLFAQSVNEFLDDVGGHETAS
jgi:pimeloyl-ACP methyl ester carboxylesterase/nucleoside-diphosphate-sugar epimerase